MLKKHLIIFALMVLFHQLFTSYLYTNIFPIHYLNRNFFFLDLTVGNLIFNYATLCIFDGLTVLMLWLLGRKLFGGWHALLPATVYAVSPWGSYLVAAGSSCVFFLLLVLTNIYGLMLIRSRKLVLGTIFATTSLIFAVYSSIFLLFLFPLIFLGLVIIGFAPIKEFRLYSIVSAVLIIPLVFLIIGNSQGFRNILVGEVGAFSDPGLVNTVNSFRGEAIKENVGFLARLSENKYVFSGEYLLVKFARHLVPSTFFTPEEKMLDFSFSPPIYLGFLIPFVYGVYTWLRANKNKRIILLSFLLIAPSLFAKVPVDLNRLIIFSPIVIFSIAVGFIKLFSNLGRKSGKVALSIMFILLLIQFAVVVGDISFREKARFEQYNGQNYEIK